MEMHECNSSQIRRYGYDPETRTMRVEFQRGGLYEYTDVPPEVFAAFLESNSKGSYHYHHIKGSYHYERIGG